MPIRRLLTLCVFTLLCVASVQAQRQRAVRSGLPFFTPQQPPPQTGPCHTFGLVRPGLKASYLSVTPDGSATYTITWISDQPTRTETTQQVQTPQGTGNAVTVVDGEIVGNLRAMKHINVKTTIAVPILGSITTTVDIDFVPSLALGPQDGWCVGKTWSVGPTMQTITSSTPGLPVQIIHNNIELAEGKVLAVNEKITVNGVEYNTVKYASWAMGANNALQPSITWTSTEHNVVVRQEAYDSVGNLVTTTTATHIE
ncbi:MAG TPA: hypothetical protein VEK11_22920 [Thermoanaerobaculia bacterium]|jgi:hypothetical protein|nr:hypothetical protein [Thermoanaerobaculia bacterium]